MSKEIIRWARELQALAQAGLAYPKDKYDVDRFIHIRDIAAEMMAAATDIEPEKIHTLYADQLGYQTPKLETRAAVFKDDKILLVHEKIDGCWSLPGGWVEHRCSVAENAVKEVREEAGYAVTADRIFAVIDRNRRYPTPFIYDITKVFVLCTLIDGGFADNIETSECGFFSRDELPPLSVERTCPSDIDLCFDALAHPDAPVIFD